MPIVLKQLMRHSIVQTTEKFYAVGNAAETADPLWESLPQKSGSILGNIRSTPSTEASGVIPETPERKEV